MTEFLSQFFSAVFERLLELERRSRIKDDYLATSVNAPEARTVGRIEPGGYVDIRRPAKYARPNQRDSTAQNRICLFTLGNDHKTVLRKLIFQKQSKASGFRRRSHIFYVNLPNKVKGHCPSLRIGFG